LLYSIIILCHNQLETTKRCLDLLFKTDLSKAEIIVIDNASVDGTWEYLQSMGHRLDVIFRNSENIGVGAGYTTGFKFAITHYFVTLNNDIEIYDSDWLEKLHAPFDLNPKMALVGVEGTGCYLDRMGMGHPHPTIKDYVEGSCMMGRTDVVRECGGLFDPAYRFGYCEDADLSLRVRKRGYEIAHVPLGMKHIRSVTSDSVKEEIDIDGFHAFNHMILKKKWWTYLKTKSFREEVAIQRTIAMGDVLWMTPVLRQM
jgi:O-antigen biosynthesis protein